MRLITMLRNQRVAALGTRRPDGGTLVSLIAFVPEADYSAFYLQASRLAQHTQDFLQDPRAGLMIAESDGPAVTDPQTLGRLSLRGEVLPLPANAPEYARVSELYLARFPVAVRSFGMTDFGLYRFAPKSGRYIAGLGQAFNLLAADLVAMSSANRQDTQDT
jgi:hypothetical protein